jgi:hypothetical protein
VVYQSCKQYTDLVRKIHTEEKDWLVIEIDSPGKPHACSSPIAHQAKKGNSEIKIKKRIQRPG